jgi:hypothetical protein
LSRPELTEEQLRALEEQMEQLTPDDIMLDALVSLINLGARKLRPDLPPGEEAKGRDLPQARQAIDGARALLGQVEARHAAELGQVREALSRLQMAFVQLSEAPAEAPPGGPPPVGEPPADPATPGDAGPAQRSGRLWVPGQ